MRLAIIMGALLAGCAANAEMQSTRKARADQELADALKGRVAGRPVDCISTSRLQGPSIIDQSTILYREGQRVWRAQLMAECPSLSPFTTLIVELHGSRLCRNDRFRVLEPGTSIPSAYCRFGQFTPYTKQ